VVDQRIGVGVPCWGGWRVIRGRGLSIRPPIQSITWLWRCAGSRTALTPHVSYMDNECSTGKIAVCGGKVRPDCVFQPQTAIFVRKHQDYLVNEVIYPANDPDELPRQ
jgi:hypothetical protein